MGTASTLVTGGMVTTATIAARWTALALLVQAAACAPAGSGTAPAGRAESSSAASQTAAPATVDHGVRSRNIVRRKLPQGTQSIALEYTVVLIDEAGNQKTVDPVEYTFKLGDSFLVRIKPQDDLYVYVFNEGPNGTRTCLLPSRDEQAQFVRGGEEVTLPDDGGYFSFEPPAGEEKLVVVAVPEPVQDLRLLAGAAFPGQSSPLESSESDAAKRQADTALEAMRGRADQGVRSRGAVRKVIERFDQPVDPGMRITHVEPPGEGEASSYAIAITGASAGAPELILDIPLKSRAGR